MSTAIARPDSQVEAEPLLVLPQKEVVKLREKLKGYGKTVWGNFLDMGRGLYKVKVTISSESRKPLYEEWGFKTFVDYCQIELGLPYQTGYDYAKVYKAVDDGLMTRDFVLDVGIHKAKKLAALSKEPATGNGTTILTHKNADKWMDLARGTNVNEFRVIVSEKKKEVKEHDKKKKSGGEGGGDVTKVPSKAREYKLYMPDVQYDLLQIALKKCNEVNGGNKKEPWLLECICLDFMATPFHGKNWTKKGVRDLILARAGELFNCKVFAVDIDSDKMVYGTKRDLKAIIKVLQDHVDKLP